MANNLVIVESPAKVKTIKKYLGKSYVITASNGHIRDLPKSNLGIDIDNEFEPKYITIRGKGDLLSSLKKEVKKADKIFLATDPDREGEAISWHLIKALKLDETDKKIYRISFNEITKKSIQEAIKSPKELNLNLVNAQQTRRILDRIVGYLISPILWAKVKRGLSAGRVQSAALRIIAKREKQIEDFIKEEYWNLEANLFNNKSKGLIKAKFFGKSKKIDLSNEKEVDKIIDDLSKSKYVVDKVSISDKEKKSPLAFTTSTLQQEASRKLNFSTQKTMRLAQQLYEGLDIKSYGTIALITYLRTDSTRVSDYAKQMAKEYISLNHGKEYNKKVDESVNKKTKTQDAHEAIRPIDINIKPNDVKDALSRDLYKLYKLIWERFLASRMSSAIYSSTSINIKADSYVFKAIGQSIKFPGYLSVYNEKSEDISSDSAFRNLEEKEELKFVKLEKEQHFTSPPSHYNEASLVRALEEGGIGRPSTYAPTITTILGRRYVIKEQKNLYITELGKIVDDIMQKSFSDIVDIEFTAKLEKLLDDVEEGNINWKKIIKDFYPKLEADVKNASKNLESIKIKDEISDEVCDICGKHMLIKYGRYGKFLACSDFPNCKGTKNYLEKIGVACPKCQKDIVIKKTKKGRVFYACEDFESCDFISWNRPSSQKCPKCASYMTEKGNKIVCSSDACLFSEDKSKE